MTGTMTKGSPFKLILFFAIPLYIGNMFQQLYSTVDTVIVSRSISVEAMTAVGITGWLVFLILGFGQGCCTGLSVITAQFYGAKDMANVKKSVAVSIVITAIITVIITIIGVVFCRDLLEFMRTPSDIIDMSNDYLIVIYACTFTAMLYNLSANMIRALGDSKTPLYFLILASILNIILDLFFILGLGFGVEGAAYATVISQLISGSLCVLYIKKKFPQLTVSKSDFTFTKEFITKHLNSALPLALQFSIISIGLIALQFVLNGFGTDFISAYTAGSKIELLLGQFFPSLGAAVVTYTAQNYGAGNLTRIKEGVKQSMIIMTGYTIIAMSLVFLLGNQLIWIIVGDVPSYIHENAKLYLTFCAYAYFPLGSIFVYRNTLQGLAKSKITVFAGVIELVDRCLIAYYGALFLGFTGVCLATPLNWVITAIYLFIAYKITMKKMDIQFVNNEAII